MKNSSKSYLVINGKKTELTKDQLKQLGIVTDSVYLSSDGKIAHIGEYEFIIIKTNEEIGTIELLLKESLCQMAFGEKNDFKTSEVRKRLDEFADEIAEIVGDKNLLEHEVNLIADDGLKCYGKIKSKMSLLTANMARENVEILDEFKLEEWWWTCTAFGTLKHGNDSLVKCVSPRGDFNNYDGGRYYCGVRPFCILNSNIFNS